MKIGYAARAMASARHTSTGTGSAELVAFVLEGLRANADPKAAREMAAYMKTTQPFLGVPNPKREPIFREMCQTFAPADDRAYRASVLALWAAGTGGVDRADALAANTISQRRDTKMVPPAYSGPREMLYAACHYAERFKEHHTPAHLPLFKRMIIDGGWWDIVDWVAAKMVEQTFHRHRQSVTPIMTSWLRDHDLWLRRSALLCQLHLKAETDEQLLFSFCLDRAEEQDFFIRKAIGWALRQYAWTNPESVRAFLDEHGGAFSPLTVREASKNLGTPKKRTKATVAKKKTAKRKR